MADDDWRAQGEHHVRKAINSAGEDPLVHAVLAVYLEMRHSHDDSDEIIRAMNKLSGALYDHRMPRGS
jgi:hypothetical protein